MDKKQEQALTDKLTGIGYPTFEVLPGDDDILMLHVDDYFICGAGYALSLSDADLLTLIDETVG